MAAQTQPRPPSRRLPVRLKAPWPAINWPWFALLVLFIGYWFFASNLERIDANQVLARIFVPNLPPSQAALVPFSPLATWLVEMFHPRVLRHFIPVFVGWWLAVQAAISLMQVLYNCPDRRTAAEFLRRQRRDRPGSDLYVISAKNFDEERASSILLGVGGPVTVQIPPRHAAVTERNGRKQRVLPPGIHNLGRFEYVHSIVDLQPQEKTATDVTLLTKEGIPLRADIGLTFRIDPGNSPVTHDQPFPFSVEAVQRAAYSGTVGPGGKVSSWADAPLGKVRGALSNFVSNDSLDDLLAAESPRDAHHLVTQAVMRQVWAGKPDDYIKPLRMTISRLTPPLEVSRQYTEYWLARQRKEDMVARANGTAQLVREAETARAAAELSMVQAVSEGIRNAQQDSGSNLSGYLLVLRLMEALRRMFHYSADSLEDLGGDAEKLLSEIEAVDDRLGKVQDQLKLPPPPKFRPSSPV